MATYACLFAGSSANTGVGWRINLVNAYSTKSRNGSKCLCCSCQLVLSCAYASHALVIAMKRSELFSRILITVAIIGVVGTPLFFWSRTPLIHAKIAENGGWSTDVIQAEVGKPLHLKLTS